MICMSKSIHYYWQILCTFSQQVNQNMQTWLCQLPFSIRISMVSMFEDDWSWIGTTGRCSYATAGRERHCKLHVLSNSLSTKSKKYMRDYDSNKESFYLLYWNINNLYRCPMLQKLLVNGFEWRKYMFSFDKFFIRNYDKDSDTGHILESQC